MLNSLYPPPNGKLKLIIPLALAFFSGLSLAGSSDHVVYDLQLRKCVNMQINKVQGTSRAEDARISEDDMRHLTELACVSSNEYGSGHVVGNIGKTNGLRGLYFAKNLNSLHLIALALEVESIELPQPSALTILNLSRNKLSRVPESIQTLYNTIKPKQVKDFDLTNQTIFIPLTDDDIGKTASLKDILPEKLKAILVDGKLKVLDVDGNELSPEESKCHYDAGSGEITVNQYGATLTYQGEQLDSSYRPFFSLTVTFAKKIGVTYDCNGGTPCPEKQEDLAVGDKIEKPEDPKIDDNHVLKGWCKASAPCPNYYKFGEELNGDLTLVADYRDTSGSVTSPIPFPAPVWLLLALLTFLGAFIPRRKQKLD